MAEPDAPDTADDSPEATVDEATVRRLLATVPSEFVAARTAAVKALRASGQRPAAVMLATLRRLGAGEWALNALAGERPDVVAAFADASDEVLAAQEAAMAGRPDPALRDLVKAQREHAAATAAGAREVATARGVGGAGTSIADFTAKLAAVAANPAAVSLLRRGLIGAEDPGIVDPFAGAGPAGVRSKGGETTSRETRPKRQAPQRSSTIARVATPAPRPSAPKLTVVGPTRRERIAADKARATADRVVARAEAAVADATARLADAERALQEATASRAALD